MSSKIVQDILERAKASQSSHQPLLLFPEMGDNAPHTIIVSCADPRVNPEKIFQLKPEDGVIVFRTIAGHPQNALDGILALDVALRIDDILILHHTDCGATYWTEDLVKGALKQRAPDHGHEIDQTVFGAMKDIPNNLKEDVSWLKSSPLMRKELTANVRGFLFDITTGKLEEVP